MAGRPWARRNRPVADRNEKAERRGHGPAVEGIGLRLGDRTAAERPAALAAVGRGRIDDQVDVAVSLGDLLERPLTLAMSVTSARSASAPSSATPSRVASERAAPATAQPCEIAAR